VPAAFIPSLCPASNTLEISDGNDDAWANLKDQIMSRNTIVHATDPDGTPVVGVVLSKGQKAWLTRADFERINALHPRARWSLNPNTGGRTFVRIRPPGSQRNVYVARLVAGDFQRTVVRYHDGDTLNLRRKNLHHDSGAGGLTRRRKLSGRAALRIPTDEAGNISASPTRH
jgi:hypothetical protein